MAYDVLLVAMFSVLYSNLIWEKIPRKYFGEPPSPQNLTKLFNFDTVFYSSFVPGCPYAEP